MNLGGAERQLLLLCNLLKEEVAIEIISLDVDGPLLARYQKEFPNISVIDSTKHSKFIIIRKLRKLIKRNHPDVVITWLYKADILGGIATKLAGKTPVVWSARNSAIPDFSYLKKLILVLLSRVIPAYIVANGKPASKFHKSIGYPSDKMKVIPNLLSPWASIAKSKSKLLTSKNPISELRIGIAARQVSGKGILESINSIFYLPENFPKVTLLLAGQATEESKVWRRNGLYLGYVAEQITTDEDLSSWFTSLDLYLMPSTLWESQPNSLLEAIAIGCPVLCSNQFDLDINIPASLTYDTSNPHGLREALGKYLGRQNEQIIEDTSKLGMYIREMTEDNLIAKLWKSLIKASIKLDKL